MTVPLEEVLRKLGWDDGFQIPIANAENQALEDEVARLTLQRVKTRGSYENVTNRFDALQNHFKFVLQENEQSEKLISAHKQQLESEEHQFHTCKAEKAGLEQDLKEASKRLNQLEGKCESKKSELTRNIAKIDKIKAEVDWDEEAIKAWEESLKKRDEDNELIKKFSIEDERKYNELEAKRQLLQNDLVARTQCISKMICDLNDYENIIDRTGKVIKQQVTERDGLIAQWKDTVRALQQRDHDIAKAQEEMLETQLLIQQQTDLLEEQKGFLKIEQQNNHNIQREIDELNVLNSRLRRDLDDMIQYSLYIQSETSTLKRTMASFASNLENVRIKGKQLEEEMANKENAIEKFSQDLEALNSKFKEITTKCTTALERTRHLEHLLQYEERQYDIFLIENDKMQKVIYRVQTQMEEQRVLGTNLDLEINNVTLGLSNLQRFNKLKSKEVETQKEIAYEIDYRIDELENKLYELEAVKPKAHLEEKEFKIAKLEKEFAEQTEVRNVLQDQLNRIHDEMRRMTMAIQQDKEQIEVLKNKLEDQVLYYEIGKKHVAAVKQAAQEHQVEENLLRLRINLLTNDMKKQEKSIFSLQRLRLGLERTMKRRLVEIQTTKDVIQTKRRNLDEDRGRLKADISLRNVRIEQLQKKYHVTLLCLGQGEDGQPLSVAQVKIKNAQEKYLLQQEGDALDAKIKKAEKEIVAMENTLKVVKVTNDAFKYSLAPIKDDDVEVKEMKLLEKNLQDMNDKLRKQKKELAKKKQVVEDYTKMLEEVEARREQVKQKLRDTQEEYLSIDKQLATKNEKLSRTECLLKKIGKQLRKTDIEKYERDFEIRQLKDVNKNILQSLIHMIVEHPKTEHSIMKYTTEYHIILPKRKTTPSVSSESSFLSISTPCSMESEGTVSSSLKKVTLTLDV